MPEYRDLTIKLSVKQHNHITAGEQTSMADPTDIRQRVTV
jgi:hypothetical protein